MAMGMVRAEGNGTVVSYFGFMIVGRFSLLLKIYKIIRSE